MHDDDLAARVDEDGLAAHADQSEARRGAVDEPGLVAVALVARGVADAQVAGGGYEIGYCCLNAALRDYGRLGVLLANYGAQGGKQIIPAEWVKAATTASAPYLRVGFATANNGYGYQTWLTDREGRFAALGVRGQAIFVDPASKLVVVHTAVWIEARDTAARGEQFRLWGRLLNTLSKDKTL